MLQDEFGGKSALLSEKEETWRLIPPNLYLFEEHQEPQHNYWLSSYGRVAKSQLQKKDKPKRFISIFRETANKQEAVKLNYVQHIYNKEIESSYISTRTRKIADLIKEVFPELVLLPDFTTRFIQKTSQIAAETKSDSEEYLYYTYDIYSKEIKYYKTITALQRGSRLSMKDIDRGLVKQSTIHNLRIYRNTGV